MNASRRIWLAVTAKLGKLQQTPISPQIRNALNVQRHPTIIHPSNALEVQSSPIVPHIENILNVQRHHTVMDLHSVPGVQSSLTMHHVENIPGVQRDHTTMILMRTKGKMTGWSQDGNIMWERIPTRVLRDVALDNIDEGGREKDWRESGWKYDVGVDRRSGPSRSVSNDWLCIGMENIRVSVGERVERRRPTDDD